MKRKSMTKGDELRKQVRGRKAEQEKEDHKNDRFLWVPTGSILFNLACSDKWNGGYKTGTMNNIIGDSSAGKSILVLSGMAEAANMRKFKDYRFIYDDAEYANSFDMNNLFGSAFTNRLENPYKNMEGSISIEQFSDTIHTELDKGQPIIYTLDSFDAIDSDNEIEKESKNRKGRLAGNNSKVKGTFDMTKQKKASQIFRQICSKLKKTNSLLLIISQTRANLDAFSFKKHTRSGGYALKFYASIEAWLAHKAALTKTKNKKKYKIGGDTLTKVEKNKLTGKKREVPLTIYYDYGIDDISSCIDFLLENEWWDTKKKTIIAPEFGIDCTKEKLIKTIEEELSKKVLFKTVQECWNDIEKSLKLNRRSKFE